MASVGGARASSAHPDPADLALRWRDLAGRQGFAEVIESAASVLPASTTAHVVYDLGIAVSLALGDLADAVETLPAGGPDATRAGETGPAGAGEHAS